MWLFIFFENRINVNLLILKIKVLKKIMRCYEIEVIFYNDFFKNQTCILATFIDILATFIDILNISVDRFCTLPMKCSLHRYLTQHVWQQGRAWGGGATVHYPPEQIQGEVYPPLIFCNMKLEDSFDLNNISQVST